MYAAQAFIQWKGTDVCCDFECTCGNYGHIDTEFMYYVRCAECGTLWESPTELLFKEADDDDATCVVTLPVNTDEGE